MKDKTMYRIAIVASFVGLIILVFYAQTLELEVLPIGSIDQSHLDLVVKIKGEVKALKEFKGRHTFELVDSTGYMDVVVFSNEKPGFSKGDLLEVLGEIGEYSGSLQMVARRIDIVEEPSTTS